MLELHHPPVEPAKQADSIKPGVKAEGRSAGLDIASCNQARASGRQTTPVKLLRPQISLVKFNLIGAQEADELVFEGSLPVLQLLLLDILPDASRL